MSIRLKGKGKMVERRGINKSILLWELFGQIRSRIMPTKWPVDDENRNPRKHKRTKR